MRILITGKNSYIGNSVKSWLNEKEPSIIVEEISLRNISLNKLSFSGYDVVFHVAGSAHISSTKKLLPEYFKINRDLAIEVANKAKKEGVKQFIFISSMAIYGGDRLIGNFNQIDIEKPKPINSYGQSKLEADLEIQNLKDEKFYVAILRIPMVYGNNSKGNFLKLFNFSLRFPLFPNIKNIRSVIHVNNLSELVRQIIINKLYGIFFPQDIKYFDTTNFVLKNRSIRGKKTVLIPFLGIPLRILSVFIKSINKIYGNKYYNQAISKIDKIIYQLFSIDDVIEELKDV